MTADKGYKRSAWEDRFNRPTMDGLRGILTGEEAKLFNAIHKQVSSLEGVVTSFVWHNAAQLSGPLHLLGSGARSGEVTTQGHPAP